MAYICLKVRVIMSFYKNNVKVREIFGIHFLYLYQCFINNNVM